MDVNWVEVGRRLAEEAVGLTKQERLSLVRKRAYELKRSPHSVGRFLVLVEFLKLFKIDASDEERLPLGVIEVVHRMHLKDPAMAQTLLDEILKKGMTYRDALKRMTDLTAAIEKSSDADRFQPSQDVYQTIIDRLGMYDVDDLKFIKLGGYEWCLSSVSSSWRTGDIDIAIVSEADTVYSFKRGYRNFARNIFLAKNEYDHVIVEFTSRPSFISFRNYCAMLKSSAETKAVLTGFHDGDVRPDRKAWAHLSKAKR